MNIKISLLFSLFFALPALCGVGGSSGGLSANRAQTVTVRVCDGGESGTLCRQVTYRVRPQSPARTETCEQDPNGSARANCVKSYGIPNWLNDLNQAFEDAGFSIPDPQIDPNN